jgi:hypothetical protein
MLKKRKLTRNMQFQRVKGRGKGKWQEIIELMVQGKPTERTAERKFQKIWELKFG